MARVNGCVKRRGWCLAALAALSVSTTARGDATDDVKGAIEALYGVKNYSWVTKYVGGGGEDVSGKLENGGYMSLSVKVDGKQKSLVIKGYIEAVLTDAGWKTAEELVEDPNQQALASEIAGYVETPVEHLQGEVERVPSFTQAGDGTFAGDLSTKGAASLLKTYRQGARVDDPKGTLKVAVMKGTVSQVVLHLTGTLRGDGADQPIDRTITTTISNIDQTTPDVPAAAKAEMAK